MDFFNMTSLECFLLAGVGVLLLVQLLYYAVLYNRLYRQHTAEKKGKLDYTDEYAPISVILSAKDAAGWLKANLPVILEQDYPCYEVIVVNDGSADDTEEVLKLLESRYPHLYHTFTPERTRYVSRKKLSLTLGIRAAKYEWLVFTEPDCCPASSEWLKSLARNFTPETDIVLGYSNYIRKKGWFNRKIVFDRLFYSMRFLSCASLKCPYTGIGANLAYRKGLYYCNKGYASHLNLQRGEDDLFVNQTATAANTRVECSRNSIVRVLPPEYEKTWAEDKIGHAATEHLYKGFQPLMMGMETCSRLLFVAGCAALWIYAVCCRHWAVGLIALLMWAARYACQLTVFHRLSVGLDERHYVLSLPLFEILQPLWNLHYRLVWLFRRRSDFMRK